ncbi:MAG: D-amino acid dehydrogenase [Planctomycetales bacterium]|nr:D-amino acid dehydrogenase [Planctomycetales bacterium]MCC0025175.1 D-amino acid dehydrogenase [Hyphomicrobiaceae bacterium]
MKVIVVGAGVIGVTSAYFLAKAGCQVTVVERRSSSALETSFANAGQISPGMSAPWAAPGVPIKAAKWMLTANSPLVFRPTADPAQWRWILQFLGNCNAKAYDRNKGRMVRLAEYSRDVLERLRAEHGLSYDNNSRGILQLFRTRRQMVDATKDTQVLERLNVEHQLLDRDSCVQLEPGLALVKQEIVGGLRLIGDETGDCRLFTNAMREICETLGVQFMFDVEVKDIHAQDEAVSRLVTSDGDIVADAYVLAAASWSTKIAAQLKLELPVYPVKGYSVSASIIDPQCAPRSSIMDETNKVAITRLGDRVRIGGMAEISGYGGTHRKSALRTLARSYKSLFPTVGEIDETSFWQGLRPATPDGTPIVGGTRYSNLFLNTGHGTLGWTMACGSAKIIADVITDTPTEIESGEFEVSRYSGTHGNAH